MSARLGPLVLAMFLSGCFLPDGPDEPDSASGQALDPGVPQGDDGIAPPKGGGAGAGAAGKPGASGTAGGGASSGSGAGSAGKASGGSAGAGGSAAGGAGGSAAGGATGTAGKGGAGNAGNGTAGKGSAGAAGNGTAGAGDAGVAGSGSIGGGASSNPAGGTGGFGASGGAAGAGASTGGTSTGGSGGAATGGGGGALAGAAGTGGTPTTPAGSWATTTPLKTARYGHQAVRLLDGRVLVIGGGHCQESLASVELWDPALAAWTAAPSLTTPRLGHRAVVTPNGQVVVVGGERCAVVNQQYQCEYLASTEVWTPGQPAWAPGPDLWQARSHHQMVAIDGRILVVGGHRWVGDELLTTWVERLDPGAAAWNAVGQMPGRLGHQLVARPDGKVIVIGGVDATYTPTTSTFVLDPLAGTALAGPSLLQHRAWARAVTAAGVPLVIGGTASCSSQECLLSETLAGPTWQIAGFTSAPREDHTATVLQDDTVLVVGSNFAFAMGSAERYVPSLGWHAASPPNVGRAGHTATLLSDGRVLIAGGYTSTTCEVTASSEVFTP